MHHIPLLTEPSTQLTGKDLVAAHSTRNIRVSYPCDVLKYIQATQAVTDYIIAYVDLNRLYIEIVCD